MNKELIEREVNKSYLKQYVILAILAASASAIQIIESPLPRFLPWLKPGLSNSIVLYALLRYSPMLSVGIIFFRTFLTGLFLGTLFSPVSIISFAGGIVSTFVMILVIKLLPNCGLSSISILGAMSNNIAQLFTVQVMFAGNMTIWFHLAVMIWISIPSGLIVAKVSQELLRRTV